MFNLKKCNCGKFPYEHYMNIDRNEMIYVCKNTDPDLLFVSKANKCHYFCNNNLINNCKRKVCSFKHVLEIEEPNENNTMSILLSEHIKDGIVGWFSNIDIKDNVMNNILNLDELKDKNKCTICLKIINTIYNSYLYYKIIDEMKNSSGVSCDYLSNKFNLLKVFKNISNKIVSPMVILMYMPGIYYYNNLFFCEPIKILGKRPILNLDPIEKQLRAMKKVKFQPKLREDSEWLERHSRNIKINNTGVIYYLNKKTNKKTWIHPITKQTNLPGGYKTPEEAGLI
tara:strand:- start:25 stop:876 length:852 start_codon:yes stop_codon:yes gene_type:complete